MLVEDDEGEDQEDEYLQKLSRAFDKSLDIGKSPTSSSFSLVVIVDDNNYVEAAAYINWDIYTPQQSFFLAMISSMTIEPESP